MSTTVRTTPLRRVYVYPWECVISEETFTVITILCVQLRLVMPDEQEPTAPFCGQFRRENAPTAESTAAPAPALYKSDRGLVIPVAFSS